MQVLFQGLLAGKAFFKAMLLAAFFKALGCTHFCFLYLPWPTIFQELSFFKDFWEASFFKELEAPPPAVMSNFFK